jgi:hypothetical protein
MPRKRPKRIPRNRPTLRGKERGQRACQGIGLRGCNDDGKRDVGLFEVYLRTIGERSKRPKRMPRKRTKMIPRKRPTLRGKERGQRACQGIGLRGCNADGKRDVGLFEAYLRTIGER